MSLYNDLRKTINNTAGFTLEQKRALRLLAASSAQDGITTGAGAGITAGTGTIANWYITSDQNTVKSELLIDLTGLHGSTTDLDIIGVTGAASAHFGQILTANHGTIIAGHMECLEVPVGGVTDVDLYSATESTGVEDTAITALVEVATVTAGGVWTVGKVLPFIALPASGKYLYLTNGAGGVPGDFTAGQFKITLTGTK